MKFPLRLGTKRIGQIKVGKTERDIRNELETNLRTLGADDVAFNSIVATGPNSAIPHHEPTDREVAREIS